MKVEVSNCYRSLLVCAGLLGAVFAQAEPVVIADHVLQHSPKTQSVATEMMNQTLVQDVLRVGDKLFLAGERGHIGWSDDNGKTWQQAQVPTIQDLNALFFITQDIGWAVGHDGNIFNTTDGGQTWLMQLDGLEFNLKRAQASVARYSGQLALKQAEYDVAQAPVDALIEEQEVLQVQLNDATESKKPTSKIKKRLAAIELALPELEDQALLLDDEVFELDFQVRDATSILTEENAPWPLMDIWFKDRNTGYAVGAFNAFLKTEDGGKSWVDISTRIDNPDGFHLNSVSGIGSVIFAVGEMGLIFRSQDDGETWESLASPNEGSFFALYLSEQESSLLVDENMNPLPQESHVNVLMTGLEGFVFRSADSGDTWQPVEHELNYNLNAIYMDESTGLLLMVGNDGAIVYSSDGGATLQGHRLIEQVTMSSVTVAANGAYVIGSAKGIILTTAQFDK